MSEGMFEEEDFTPRQVDWRLWRRILGHLKPHPRAVITMTGCGAILAGVESSEDRIDSTTRAPSEFTAPAGTSSPTRFSTGSASPVMC